MPYRDVMSSHYDWAVKLLRRASSDATEKAKSLACGIGLNVETLVWIHEVQHLHSPYTDNSGCSTAVRLQHIFAA